MTTNEINKFIERLASTEKVDSRSEVFKKYAMEYLKLYCDAVKAKGKNSLKNEGREEGELSKDCAFSG